MDLRGTQREQRCNQNRKVWHLPHPGGDSKGLEGGIRVRLPGMPVSSGRTGKEGHSVMYQARGEVGRFVRGTGFVHKVPAAITRGRNAGGYTAGRN